MWGMMCVDQVLGQAKPVSTCGVLALAPMQDVTDIAFLRVLHALDSEPDIVVTPYMRSTRTTCAMNEGPLRCIVEQPVSCRLWAQLAGSDPEPLVRDARELMQRWGHSLAGINLNAGCPSPLVNRHGAGAALLRDLPRLHEVCQALRRELPSFSIKCRLGWASADEFPRLLEVLAAAQPDMLMVHARTRRQLYGGVPLRSAVAEAVQHMACPVLANGDINTLHDAAEWVAAVHPAGLMIGRGAVANPFIFRQLRGGAAPSAADMLHYFDLLIEETGHTLKAYSEKGHCNRLKKFLAYCYPMFVPEAEYALRRATTLSALRAALQLREPVSCKAQLPALVDKV